MISFVAVALSGYISALVIGLFAVGVVISWISNFGEREQPTWLWNSIVLGVLALFVIDGIVSGDWLLAAINFTCFILLGKLFNRRTAKDTFQIYLLSFLLFIASGVLNPGLSYAVVFPIYIVVLTLALLSLHLRHDLTDLREKSERIHGPDIALRHEEALLARGRLFRGRLFVGTAVLAIAAFLSSMVIFYLFPRLGFGFFVGKKRPGMSVAGFSDNVRLGSFGRIRNNYQVVMRVELPDEKGPRRLRLRGMSFDTYTGRGWVKGTRRRWQPRSVTRSGETLYLVGLRTSYDHRVQIYQEPLSSQVVFGEPKVVRVAVRDFREGMRDPNAPKILRDRSGDLFYKSPDSVAVSYTAYSDTIVPSVAELRKSKGVLPRTIVSRYTALPHMDGRIRQLAMAIVRGKETVYDRVVAIERHLKYNYRYSLRGGHDFRQPLVDFLFNKRYGHCEFFSTTMAVMLRQIGVPSRVVTGFYGGVWNRFGRYMAIRQNDAHAWVEVYFPGPGWVTFDPTPTGELLVPDESGTLGFMKSWLDALQLRWFKWVIEYDLQRQIRIFQSMIGWIQKTLRGRKSSNRMTWLTLRAWLRRIFTWRNAAIAGLVGLVLFGLLVMFRRARPILAARRGARAQGPAQRHYQRMLALLTRAGFRKRASQTALEFVESLRQERFAGTLLVQRITNAYQANVFGGRPWDQAEAGRWLAELKPLVVAHAVASSAAVVTA